MDPLPETTKYWIYGWTLSASEWSYGAMRNDEGILHP